MNAENANHAQAFCTEENAWLVQTCQRKLQNWDYPNHRQGGQDLAQEIFSDCGKISNERWSAIENKRAYVATMAEHRATRLLNRREIPTESSTLASLQYGTASSEPLEAMEAGILIDELSKRLSQEEQNVLELIYQGFSEKEIAQVLGKSYSAARKQISRLYKKISSHSQTGIIHEKSAKSQQPAT